MSVFIFILKALRAIVIIWVILYLYLKYAHTYWKRRGVRSLPGHWFFGHAKNVLLMRKPSAIVFGDLYHQGSEDDDVLGIYVVHKPFLMLRNPKLIKQILIKDFNYFSDRYFTARSINDTIGSSTLFTMKNPEWKYLRTRLTPVFTSGKVKNLFPLIVQTADSMKNYLQTQFTNGTRTKTLPMKEIALKYTTDIISSIAFGIQVNSFDPSQNTFFLKVQKSLRITLHRGLQLFFMFFFPAISIFLGGQMLGSATNYFRKIFWDSMDTREVSKSKRGDLIDSLVDLKNAKQDNDFKFEGDALVAQAGIFFVAGRESTTTTISFTLAELAKHPDIQKRVRENILETLETQGMTYDAVQSMKYLHQVMSEVLRLYPPAPLIDRVAVEDYKIPGTDTIIEKGTPIYIPLYGLHRDPRYHPDPLSFNPDRFSDESKDNITACSYMPFGDGPRICIAQRVGLLQSAVGVITILKDYEVSLDPTGDYAVDRRNIFVSPSDQFKLKFTKL